MVILFDLFNLPEDVYEVIFSTEQQIIVSKLLINKFKEEEGVLSKSVMSAFANALHEGNVKIIYKGKKMQISYNKRQFYDRILTPLKGMGLIDYDLYKKVYKLSDHFQQSLVEIGLLWKRELES